MVEDAASGPTVLLHRVGFLPARVGLLAFGGCLSDRVCRELATKPKGVTEDAVFRGGCRCTLAPVGTGLLTAVVSYFFVPPPAGRHGW